MAKRLLLAAVVAMLAGVAAGPARADVTLGSPFSNIQAAFAASSDKGALAHDLMTQIEAGLTNDPAKDEQILDLLSNAPGAINASNAAAMAILIDKIAKKADDATFLVKLPQSSAGVFLALLQMSSNPLVSQADPDLYGRVLAHAKNALDVLGDGGGKINELRQIVGSTEPPSFAEDPPGGNGAMFDFGQSPTQTGSAN